MSNIVKIDKISKRRVWILFIFVTIAFIFLSARLFYIQIILGDKYRVMAEDERTRNVVIQPKRGAIKDTKGIKLAFSKHCYTVWLHVDAIKLNDKIKEVKLKREVAEAIEEVLDIPAEKIMDIFNSKKTGVVALQRKVDKDKGDLLKSKNLTGVDIINDTMRVYPNHNFAAHVLGHTTIDGNGLAGLERRYDKELSGVKGVKTIDVDAAGKQLAYGKNKIHPPTDGYDLVLTIDEVIQHFVEEALQKGLQEYSAKRVMAIVMDTKTGGILAMAAKPDYDPNQPRNLEPFFDSEAIKQLTNEQKNIFWNTMWKNPLVNDIYEPGSTFKLITTAVGFEENALSVHTPFSTKGYLDIYGFRIKNWDYPAQHKDFTIVEALENSWNTTFVEIARNIGKTTFYKYIENFGLNRKTGVDLLGESIYSLSEKNIGPVELATISFGHGIALTPIQLISAINAIANDGKLMQAHIVKGYMDSEGNMVEEFEPKVLKNVISVKTAQDVCRLMEKVVNEGSGKLAHIAGVRIGGKTGTSEKAVGGKYSSELAFASFVAIAPVDDPRITLLVIVDEPKETNYGSQTAAPIARYILDDTLRYIGIEPDVSGAKSKIKMPKLIGKTKYQADSILGAAGINYAMYPLHIEDENSIIISQFPAPGTLIGFNEIVILKVETK